MQPPKSELSRMSRRVFGRGGIRQNGCPCLFSRNETAACMYLGHKDLWLSAARKTVAALGARFWSHGVGTYVWHLTDLPVRVCRRTKKTLQLGKYQREHIRRKLAFEQYAWLKFIARNTRTESSRPRTRVAPARRPRYAEAPLALGMACNRFEPSTPIPDSAFSRDWRFKRKLFHRRTPSRIVGSSEPVRSPESTPPFLAGHQQNLLIPLSISLLRNVAREICRGFFDNAPHCKQSIYSEPTIEKTPQARIALSEWMSQE